MRFNKYINCIDAHTAGEPLRIVTSGIPQIPGNTMLKKRSYIRNNYDNIRKLIMLEPRGHNNMYGCIITSAVTTDGDFGVLFTHNDGYSTMCGHGIIAVTKVAYEMGIININKDKQEVKIDTPAGRVRSYIEFKNNQIESVRFINVPSFVYEENLEIELENIGIVNVDIAFGGAFYAFVKSNVLKQEVVPENVEILIKLGMKIKDEVMKKRSIVHPTDQGLAGIYGTIITDEIEMHDNCIISKNVCIFADGQVDRSPTGTGTAARVALLHQNGLFSNKEKLINKSIIDTVFEGKIVDYLNIGDYQGVVPEIKGEAYISGFNTLVLEDDDVLPYGFKL